MQSKIVLVVNLGLGHDTRIAASCNRACPATDATMHGSLTRLLTYLMHIKNHVGLPDIPVPKRTPDIFWSPAARPLVEENPGAARQPCCQQPRFFDPQHFQCRPHESRPQRSRARLQHTQRFLQRNVRVECKAEAHGQHVVLFSGLDVKVVPAWWVCRLRFMPGANSDKGRATSIHEHLAAATQTSQQQS